MVPIIRYEPGQTPDRLREILGRADATWNAEVERQVAEVIANVRERGDAAVAESTRRLHDAELSPERVLSSVPKRVGKRSTGFRRTWPRPFARRQTTSGDSTNTRSARHGSRKTATGSYWARSTFRFPPRRCMSLVERLRWYPLSTWVSFRRVWPASNGW